jgi:serine/threonine-protein kinase HipA
MGRLAIKNRRIFFEYAKDFLETGLEISPFKLPLKPGLHTCDDRLFDGLFGLFSDSLPDGWGRLLIDRKLMHLGINPGILTPLDRLRFVGSRGMGALSYAPEIPYETHISEKFDDLDRIANECLAVLEHDEDQYIEELLALNNSSAGARPKIMVRIRPKNHALTPSDNDLETKHDDWMIKFRSPLDPKDSGPIEYAYHLMALKAKLDIPDAKLFPSKKSGGFFGVKRFDRQKSSFLHMHTASGLLHADFRLPSLDYETLMKATLWLTKDVRQCEKLFRYCVFNVLAHNRDDHAKNFSFLMDGTGTWTLSPAYDLTFSSGPAGEHSTTIMREGKNPKLSHLLQLAQVGNLKSQRALHIIEEVKEAVSGWDEFAKEAQVSVKSSNLIKKAIKSVTGTHALTHNSIILGL